MNRGENIIGCLEIVKGGVVEIKSEVARFVRGENRQSRQGVLLSYFFEKGRIEQNEQKGISDNKVFKYPNAHEGHRTPIRQYTRSLRVVLRDLGQTGGPNFQV